MKVYKIPLTCDHEVLVAATMPEEALLLARRAASEHGVRVDESAPPEEVNLSEPGLVVIYPGSWSRDAVAP